MIRTFAIIALAILLILGGLFGVHLGTMRKMMQIDQQHMLIGEHDERHRAELHHLLQTLVILNTEQDTLRSRRQGLIRGRAECIDQRDRAVGDNRTALTARIDSYDKTMAMVHQRDIDLLKQLDQHQVKKAEIQSAAADTKAELQAKLKELENRSALEFLFK